MAGADATARAQGRDAARRAATDGHLARQRPCRPEWGTARTVGIGSSAGSRSPSTATRPADCLALAAGPHPGEDPCRSARSAAHARPRVRAAVARRRPSADRSPALGPARHRARRAGPERAGRPSGTSPPTRPGSGSTCATSRRRRHLLRDAEHAAALMEEGDADRASAIFAEVDARYTGDAFEDEPVRGVGRRAARGGGPRGGARCATSRPPAAGRAAPTTPRLLVRLLVADPYDEQAHRLLVRLLTRTGRHGEARRSFDRWVAAMRVIDAPLPDPAVLRPEAGAPSPRAAARQTGDARVDAVRRAAF